MTSMDGLDIVTEFEEAIDVLTLKTNDLQNGLQNIDAVQIVSGRLIKDRLPTDTIYATSYLNASLLIHGVDDSRAPYSALPTDIVKYDQVFGGGLIWKNILPEIPLAKLPQLDVYHMPDYLQFGIVDRDGVLINLLNNNHVKISTSMLDGTIDYSKVANVPSNIDVEASNVYGGLSNATIDYKYVTNVPTRFEASNVYGGLSNATLIASNLKGYYTSIVPSKEYVEPHQFYEVIDYTTSPVTVTDVPLPMQPPKYSLESTSHLVYPTISVPASNVVSDGSALDETIMPTYLHATKTLLNTTTVVKSVGAPHIVPGVFLVDDMYYDIVETDSVKEDVNNYQYTLDNIKIDYANVLNPPTNYITNNAGEFDASHLGGYNLVNTMINADYAGGTLNKLEDWTGHHETATYYETVWVDNWVDVPGEFAQQNDPIATQVAHTCNVLVQDTSVIHYTEFPDKSITMTHTLYPTVSVAASNVIGGDSCLAENTLPAFLVPTKIVTFTSSPTTAISYGNPIDRGTRSTTYTSNIRYKLPNVIVASENVQGDNLLINSNITTSNVYASNVNTTSLNVKLINANAGTGVVGCNLTMTSATASNVIAGILYVKGHAPAEFPTYFREFQAGRADDELGPDSYLYNSGDGDPGYGFMGDFPDRPFYVSTVSSGFSQPNVLEVNPYRTLKSVSRFHRRQAYEDLEQIKHYNHGWNAGNPVYPSGGFTYSIKTTDSVWSGGKLLLSSDERIKKDVIEVNSNVCLLVANCLKPSSYRLIKDNSLHVGFIAQQVDKVLPEAVSLAHGTLPNGSNVNDFHILDYNSITTVLTGAIQALTKEVREIKEQVNNILLKINDGTA